MSNEKPKIFLDLLPLKSVDWVPHIFEGFVQDGDPTKFVLRVQIENRVRTLPVWMSASNNMRPSDVFVEVIQLAQRNEQWLPSKNPVEGMAMNGGWYNPMLQWTQAVMELNEQDHDTTVAALQHPNIWLNKFDVVEGGLQND